MKKYEKIEKSWKPENHVISEPFTFSWPNKESAAICLLLIDYQTPSRSHAKKPTTTKFADSRPPKATDWSDQQSHLFTNWPMERQLPCCWTHWVLERHRNSPRCSRLFKRQQVRFEMWVQMPSWLWTQRPTVSKVQSGWRVEQAKTDLRAWNLQASGYSFQRQDVLFERQRVWLRMRFQLW